jgi:hypothetical protein
LSGASDFRPTGRPLFFIPNCPSSPLSASLPQMPAFVFFCLSLAFERKLHFGDKHFLERRVKALPFVFQQNIHRMISSVTYPLFFNPLLIPKMDFYENRIAFSMDSRMFGNNIY